MFEGIILTYFLEDKFKKKLSLFPRLLIRKSSHFTDKSCSVYVLNEFFLRVSLRFEHGYSTVQDISLICKENIKKKLFNNIINSVQENEIILNGSLRKVDPKLILK